MIFNVITVALPDKLVHSENDNYNSYKENRLYYVVSVSQLPDSLAIQCTLLI